MTAPPTGAKILVRSMTSDDVEKAETIFRLAFGTEFGLADPLSFRGDARVVGFRHAVYPDGGLVAVIDGAIAGFSISSCWGEVGVLGPVCVAPEFWRLGIARHLIRRSVEVLNQWGCGTCGLFTNPSSPRHLRLYQEFGFWPRELTILMSNDLEGMKSDSRRSPPISTKPQCVDTLISDMRTATHLVFPGLDLSSEIVGVIRHKVGEIITGESGSLDFAVCHYGAGSEGNSETFYVKYAQVAPGPDVEMRFRRLIDDCVCRAVVLGFSKITLGINTRQRHAYAALLAAGFRGQMHGLRMHRPLVDVLDAENSYVVNDWR